MEPGGIKFPRLKTKTYRKAPGTMPGIIRKQPATVTCTPRGEVKISIRTNLNVAHMTPAVARELGYAILRAADEAEETLHRNLIDCLLRERPERVAKELGKINRQGLRRAAQGKSLTRTQQANLPRLGLIHGNRLTRRGEAVLEAINKESAGHDREPEPRYVKERLENNEWVPTGQAWFDGEPIATTIVEGRSRVRDTWDTN